jgi:hypothetical protein
MDADQISDLLVSNNGRLVAAGALFLAVWVLKTRSPIRAWLGESARRLQLSAALLAILPAVAVALTSSAPPRAIIQTAIVALFGAMGLHSAVKK